MGGRTVGRRHATILGASGVAVALIACGGDKANFQNGDRASSGASATGGATGGSGAASGGSAGSSAAAGGSSGVGGGGAAGSGASGGALECVAAAAPQSGTLVNALMFEGPGTVVTSVFAGCDGSLVAAGTATSVAFPLRDGSKREFSAQGSSMWLGRFDAGGYLTWLRTTDWGAITSARSGPVARVTTDGMVTVGGTFGNYAVFGAGETNEVRLSGASGNPDGYVARYAPDGTFQWVTHFPGPDRVIWNITVASDGTTYALLSNADLEPLVVAPEFTLESGELAIVALGVGGEFLDAVRISAEVDPGVQMEALDSGGLAIAGEFEDGAVLARGTPRETTLSTSLVSDTFHASFGPDLELESSVALGATYRVTPQSDGSFVAFSLFSGTRTLGAGQANEVTFSDQAPSGGDSVVARFDASGNLVWATQIAAVPGAGSLQAPLSLPDGSAWLVLDQYGEDDEPGYVDVAPNTPDIMSLQVNGDPTVIVRFDTSGKPRWITQFQSDQTVFTERAALSPAALAIMGTFNGNLTFESSPTTLSYGIGSPLGGRVVFAAIFGP